MGVSMLGDYRRTSVLYFIPLAAASGGDELETVESKTENCLSDHAAAYITIGNGSAQVLIAAGTSGA